MCRLLTSDQNNAFSCTEISPLSEKTLYDISMCLVNDKFVYVTGGDRGELIVDANCHRYDIDRNLWQEMQSMHEARHSHSSCQLAGHIYVFCGENALTERINSVEKLSIDVDPNLQV